MSPSLAVVTDQQGIPRESLSTRIRALQEEARGLAREHIVALEAALAEVERLAVEIAAGGDAYPAGVRDIARRLAEDCELKAQTIEAISGRTN